MTEERIQFQKLDNHKPVEREEQLASFKGFRRATDSAEVEGLARR
jgi:hypothetical protein